MSPQRSGVDSGSRKGIRVDTEGLWDWNLESDRIHFSPRWIALVGCEDHEIGTTPEEWFRRVHPDESAQLAREIESARSGDSSTFACRHRLRQKDGAYRWMLCRGEVVRDKAGRAVRLTGSHSDITVEMVTDSATGLPNRLLVVDRIAHSIERARRYNGFHFAVLVIDLGRPASPRGQAAKSVNDPLITAVARRLETSLRIPDMMPSLRNNDLVARMDGDRFAILLEGLKEISHAKIVGDRILQEILKPFALSGREVHLSASIGMALSATGYTTADEVIHDAETALHRAHVLGGSRCEVFDTGALQSDQAELQLEGDFEAALQRGEFELYYQPIVSLSSNELLGFEALVRWRHPVLGMIPPADFLTVAEKSGFIIPLGDWILREACARLGAWQDGLAAAKDLSMSVNLSALQLSDETFVDRIAEALRESGLEPHRLTLELTEGIAMANPTAVITLLMRIRAMGVRISIDDFGTGYSSLAYLRQFPLDALKIDRSFVRGMVTNKDTAEIVATLIGMSRQLGLHVVAEGIEHDDQLAQLRALNCDAGQGNRFGKPVDMARAAELIKTGLALQPERRDDAAPPDSSAEHLSRIWARARFFVTTDRRSLVAGAAAAVVLFAAGFVRVASGVRPASEPTKVSVGAVVPEQAPQPAIATPPPPLPVATPSVAATSQSPTPSLPSSPPPSPSPTPALPPPLPSATRTSLAPTAAAAARVPEMFAEVVHLHKLGSCHGRLHVTRDGVAFATADNDGHDGFTLKYADFLQTLDGDTLVVKTANKTYRFKTEDSRGATHVQVGELAERMTRFR